MEAIFLTNLSKICDYLGKELYIVGGFVRNYLIDKSISKDVDLAGDVSILNIKKAVLSLGGIIKAEYKRTETLKFSLGGQDFEFTSFRADYYLKGEHVPYKTKRTKSIRQDAKRRDFKCNAVYFGVKCKKYLDPLGGISDINNKILNTVKEPEKVFCFDGLRIMRLARFTAELGFSPTEKVMESTKKFAYNLKDVSVERVREELLKILSADKKYKFSPKNGHYLGLKILDKTLVLDQILPELSLARGIEQRKDYHLYDVLEHTFKTVLYCEEHARLCALLHDIGKPYCMLKYGKFSNHAEEGANIAENILKRLKFPVKTEKLVKRVVLCHMFGVKKPETEQNARLFLVENKDTLNYLFPLMQADFRAGKESSEKCLWVESLKELYKEMQEQNVPFSVKELKISPLELIQKGVKKSDVGKTLKRLLKFTVINPSNNTPEKLLNLALYLNGMVDCDL